MEARIRRLKRWQLGPFAAQPSIVAAVILWAFQGATVGLADTAIYIEGGIDPITALSYDGVEDAMLIEAFNDPRNQNFGARGDFAVRNFAGGRRHTLMRFDITSLDGQFSSIDAATLRLFVTGNGGGTSTANTVLANTIAAANGDWVEGSGAGSVASNQFPGTSTWAEKLRGNQGSNGTPSGTPWASGPHIFSNNNGGAGTPVTDFFEPASAAGSFAGTQLAGDPVDLEFSDLTVIETWAAGDNAGIVLRLETPNSTGVGFHSSNAVSANLRPQLIIDYTPIPEPATWRLVALAISGHVVAARRWARG